MTHNNIYSDLPIPPGEFLEEVIAELGMTKSELAARMARPATKLSAIFSGDKVVTPNTALQLEKVTGVPAHIWTGLDMEFRLALARENEKTRTELLVSEKHLVTKYCYRDLVKFGYVAKKSTVIEKVEELQSFLGVTSLTKVSDLKRYQAAFRVGKGNRSPEATAAWLRMGEIKAQHTLTKNFDKSRLKNALTTMRKLTDKSPEEFEPLLRRMLSETGVVFVLCPHLPKTFVHGATFWLGSKKAVVMMTIRRGWADIFWFSLFHEIGHILLHSNQSVFLEEDDSPKIPDNCENEADKFAADLLIPPKEYKMFIQSNSYYQSEIIRFADRLNIDPGIVVGRLQHDRIIEPSWYNSLRKKYEWNSSIFQTNSPLNLQPE